MPPTSGRGRAWFQVPARLPREAKRVRRLSNAWLRRWFDPSARAWRRLPAWFVRFWGGIGLIWVAFAPVAFVSEAVEQRLAKLGDKGREWLQSLNERAALEKLIREDTGNGRTRLTAMSLVDSFADRDASVASGMEQGAREGYERLVRVLDGIG